MDKIKSINDYGPDSVGHIHSAQDCVTFLEFEKETGG